MTAIIIKNLFFFSFLFTGWQTQSLEEVEEAKEGSKEECFDVTVNFVPKRGEHNKFVFVNFKIKHLEQVPRMVIKFWWERWIVFEVSIKILTQKSIDAVEAIEINWLHQTLTQSRAFSIISETTSSGVGVMSTSNIVIQGNSCSLKSRGSRVSNWL